ncbi:hypothetical protein PC9H_004481 [Pleurotus ostreatus]|uniref:SHSP domain-containing protein n=1 Tax=Pleurotus ostreatus TaxID=5322 RepID=A0A8H6ZUV4_PLEOS|nr:uncharacterized protein PC9H_004481 [Pleurotus ostreatus]KAF7432540.1 hypothetical protein PC9H_004481 [Pleurotus ostreatus]
MHFSLRDVDYTGSALISISPLFSSCKTWVVLNTYHDSRTPTPMWHNQPAKGRAKLLKWSTPAQFHFITDRYNDFNNTIGDRDKRAKFWKSLLRDWSSVWELDRKIEQKLRNYYYNMRRKNIYRGLLPKSAPRVRRGSTSQSMSRSSSLADISQGDDGNIDGPNTKPEVLGATQAMSPSTTHSQQPSIHATPIYASNSGSAILEGDNIIVDVPGFTPSDIQTIFLAGDLLIRGERVDKGKSRENEVQCPSQLSNYMEAKIELPVGLQAEEVRVTFDAGRLTVQFPDSSELCMPVVVEELGENYTSTSSG